MTSTLWLWLGGLLCLAAGFAGGFLFARRGSSEARQRLETEQRLQDAEEQLQNYREEVTGHFRHTAELVNRLAGDYREMHNHLADGARRLCGQSGESSGLLDTLPTDSEATAAAKATADAAESVAPPLDYAPRDNPDAPGVLQEDYGFEKSSN